MAEPIESAWGIRPGTAWAEEVEAEEAKHGPLADDEAFPSLGEAVKAPAGKGKPTKKGKPVKLGLGDFLSATSRTAKSDKEILASLPKGSSGLPREERDPGALGGAFRDYGGNREGFGARRGEREEREPSRADASGDWGAERKFTPSDSRSGGSFGGGGGGGGFRDRDREGGFDRPPREDRPISEADTVDDWGANRKFTPSGDAGGRGGGGGGGFGGGGFREREGGFRDGPRHDEPSRADGGDWGARRAPTGGDQPGPSGRRGYGFSDAPASAADTEDRWSHRAPPPSEPAEGGGASERPRLKLAPRTLPVDKPLPPPSAANGAAAGDAAGGDGDGDEQQQQQQQDEQRPAPKKSNPFGAARPREEVLKEKGIDYQKEELKLEHGEVIRDKAPEEEEMEKEVEELRVRLEGMKETTPGETDTIGELEAELDDKEKALYRLQAELDDKVRFSKHRPERERERDRDRERERSSDPVSRGTSSTASAGEGDGFEVVRSTRRERSAAPAGGPPQEGGEGGGKPAEGGGAWGRGGGFRDRDRDSRGPPREREGRDRRERPDGPPARTAGGW